MEYQETKTVGGSYFIYFPQFKDDLISKLHTETGTRKNCKYNLIIINKKRNLLIFFLPKKRARMRQRLEGLHN